ncbi:amidohydrolase [Actinoplanes sp. N902-109]|nr:amidohydrolase [Actinoplanes sp. N902-109]
MSRRSLLGGAAGVLIPFPGGAGTGLLELRRDLHRHPEPPGQEARTAAVVARRLRLAGLDVTTGVGGHGVVGLLTGGRPGRRVAYRADLDAVPPDDQINGGPAPAHVCGHDLHTTIGVGVAEQLARRRDRLAGTVAFLFQPAEEALSGAAAMIDAGVLELARPAEIHALHCFAYPVGQFHTMAGFGLPGQDRGSVTLTGADAPVRAQRLADAIGASTTVTQPATSADFERFLRELTDPATPLARFVFLRAAADGPVVRVAIRCWPASRHAEIRAEIGRLAQEHGPATVSFPGEPTPAMVCPEREGRQIQRCLRAQPLHAAIPFSGEDFALFLDRLPGTYTLLGVRAPGADVLTAYPHFGTFRPDERAIDHGVRAMTGWLSARTAYGRKP